MKIYGAGLAGLLAGCHFQNAQIFEAQSEKALGHKALLRFRTPDIGNMLGLEFRKVRVHKGIWDDGFREPNIQFVNAYSMKVAGRLIDRSIWNLEPVDRWIAPEDFVDELRNRCADRIEWNSLITSGDLKVGGLAISTIPMDQMWSMVGESYAAPVEFQYKDISIRRWRIPGADVFQTVYFPNSKINLYRASITGNMLIAEYIGEPDEVLYPIKETFGVNPNACTELAKTSKQYGKIAPIDDTWRKQFQFDLTTKYNIYSLGRFATWRNLLLDDVLKDIIVIKKLMKVNSSYERSKHNVIK